MSNALKVYQACGFSLLWYTNQVNFGAQKVAKTTQTLLN